VNLLKILIFNDYAYIEGGAGKIAVESAKKLAEEGNEIIFFSAVGPISKQLSRSSIKEIICLGQKDLINSSNKLSSIISGIYNFSAVKRLKMLLSEWQPDIAHFHGVSKALTWVLISVVNSYGIPSVYTLHDFGLLCPNMGLYNFRTEKSCYLYKKGKAVKCLFTNCDKRSYLEKLWRYFRFHYTKDILKINNKINGYIAVSSFVNGIFKIYLPACKKVKVIDNPVKIIDTNNIARASSEIGDLKNFKATFLYIGRLSAEKGIDLLLGAVKSLNVKLIIIGSGEMYGLCNDYAKKVGKEKLEVLGWLEEEKIYNLMAQVQAIILPSKVMETSGIIVKEAAGYYLPAVVPDQGGITEFVVDGVNGLYFKSGDKNSLVKALRKFIDDSTLSKKLGINARKSYEDYLTKSLSYIKEVESFYKKIIKNKS